MNGPCGCDNIFILGSFGDTVPVSNIRGNFELKFLLSSSRKGISDRVLRARRPDRGTGLMSELGGWLKELGLEEYLQTFLLNDIDFDIWQELNEQDLKELGLSMGHRRKLLRALLERRSATRPAPLSKDDHLTAGFSTSDQGPATSLPEGPVKSRAEPERRPLTVMFCDLVG